MNLFRQNLAISKSPTFKESNPRVVVSPKGKRWICLSYSLIIWCLDGSQLCTYRQLSITKV